MLTGQAHSSVKLFPRFQSCFKSKPASFLPFQFLSPLNTFSIFPFSPPSLPFFLSTAFPLFPSLPIPSLSTFTFLSPPIPSSPVPCFLFCSSLPPSFLHFLPTVQLSVSQFTSPTTPTPSLVSSFSIPLPFYSIPSSSPISMV